ncbi:hypothetical protein E2C01_046083 [Portunus trituberculatus]|uniref:Uncharacterized protein n=1 Tax=Portunus trituberculatus TaxID=210409 RepID=A0A5B7FWV6_PORTR|nr:hypothetical protein [Portunus trituberculatus]
MAFFIPFLPFPAPSRHMLPAWVHSSLRPKLRGLLLLHLVILLSLRAHQGTVSHDRTVFRNYRTLSVRYERMNEIYG